MFWVFQLQVAFRSLDWGLFLAPCVTYLCGQDGIKTSNLCHMWGDWELGRFELQCDCCPKDFRDNINKILVGGLLGQLLQSCINACRREHQLHQDSNKTGSKWQQDWVCLLLVFNSTGSSLHLLGICLWWSYIRGPVLSRNQGWTCSQRTSQNPHVRLNSLNYTLCKFIIYTFINKQREINDRRLQKNQYVYDMRVNSC